MMHPVRMRLIVALANGRRRTASELADLLGDVPTATLYRHLNKLTDAGLTSVVEQRPVRGTVEKVYALPETPELTPDELANTSRDEHMRYFMTFLASLAGEFGRYLQREQIDLIADGVGYRQYPLYLTRDELGQLGRELGAVLHKYEGNGPAPNRIRRILSTVLIPTPEAAADPPSHR